jgi:23S rRNA U2552 (ribose-2'-O)-methylase RlmE/FtsJ
MVEELIDQKVELTQKGTIRKRKPKQTIYYFTQDTEDAIVEYLNTNSESERNSIYNNRIDYAFHKLAENIIHTFKFYYTEVNTINELKHEVVCILLEKLPKYKQDKGKAYSYFGTIAKRYLIVYNTNNYKKLKGKATLLEVDDDKSITDNLIKDQESILDLDSQELQFINRYIRYIDNNLFKIFPKEKEAKVADAIMELFRKRENIDILSKKAIYIYIREITESTTPVITKVIKTLKDIYIKLYNIYLDKGYVPENI